MTANAQSSLTMVSPIYSPTKYEMLAVIKKRKNELLNEIKSLEDEINDISAQIENIDILEETKTDSQFRKIIIGKKKFNMDPKKGINYMMEHEIIKSSAEDIAFFLYHGEGLNKSAIGQYLGEMNSFHIEVLGKFVRLHEFTNMILVQALRQFLWSFRLPGEAQKIDRIMECFAKHYCNCNPGVFHHTDTCYILAFSIIMLNTSLHNPSVKEKPSLQRFIEMNRGMDAGQNLPDELLSSLYNSIKKEPFKIPEDDGNDLMHTFFNPVKEGWLWKQGGRYKSWKRRWFVLADGCLYYFQYTTDKEPRGIIPLQNLKIRMVPNASNNLMGLNKAIPANSSNLPIHPSISVSSKSTTSSTSNIESLNSGPTLNILPSKGSSIICNSSRSSATSNVFEIKPMIEHDIIKACKKSDTDGGKVVEGKHCVYRMSAATPDEASLWVAALSSQTKFYLNQHYPTQSRHSISSTSTSTNQKINSIPADLPNNMSNHVVVDNNNLDFQMQKENIQSIDSDQNIPGSEQPNLDYPSGIHLYSELLSLRRQYNG